jgi:hypothetical protein
MPRKDAVAREACLLGIGRRLRTYFNDQESPVSKRLVTLLRQIETGEHGPRGSCGFVAAAVASGNRITPFVVSDRRAGVRGDTDRADSPVFGKAN